MKTPKIGKSFYVFVITTLLLFIAGVLLVSNINRSYQRRIRGAKAVLMFSRRSIHFFAEQNGRFPDSLHELNEYGKNPPDEIYWYFPPRESISGKQPNSREHSVLDGTGGLYYNSNTGELKLNLMRPLKSYWRFYLGEKRNEVPADW